VIWACPCNGRVPAARPRRSFDTRAALMASSAERQPCDSCDRRADGEIDARTFAGRVGHASRDAALIFKGAPIAGAPPYRLCPRSGRDRGERRCSLSAMRPGPGRAMPLMRAGDQRRLHGREELRIPDAALVERPVLGNLAGSGSAASYRSRSRILGEGAWRLAS